MNIRKYSEISIAKALDNIMVWMPTRIYIDDRLIWNDDLEAGKGWVSYEDAIGSLDFDIYTTTVTSVDIEIVDFHHSWVRIYSTTI